MNFSNLVITADAASYTYLPYDRGANGAFVYREQGVSVHAPRVVITTNTNDATSDKFAVQLNTPRVCAAVLDCAIDTVLGTDIVKTELRFLATTSSADRKKQISQHIALLEELRATIQNRQVIYS